MAKIGPQPLSLLPSSMHLSVPQVEHYPLFVLVQLPVARIPKRMNDLALLKHAAVGQALSAISTIVDHHRDHYHRLGIIDIRAEIATPNNIQAVVLGSELPQEEFLQLVATVSESMDEVQEHLLASPLPSDFYMPYASFYSTIDRRSVPAVVTLKHLEKQPHRFAIVNLSATVRHSMLQIPLETQSKLNTWCERYLTCLAHLVPDVPFPEEILLNLMILPEDRPDYWRNTIWRLLEERGRVKFDHDHASMTLPRATYVYLYTSVFGPEQIEAEGIERFFISYAAIREELIRWTQRWIDQHNEERIRLLLPHINMQAKKLLEVHTKTDEPIHAQDIHLIVMTAEALVAVKQHNDGQHLLEATISAIDPIQMPISAPFIAIAYARLGHLALKRRQKKQAIRYWQSALVLEESQEPANRQQIKYLQSLLAESSQ